MASLSRAELRQILRARRRLVTAAERARVAKRIAAIASRASLLRPDRRVAAYLPYGHETDTSALIQTALRHRCRLFLPVVTHADRYQMHFVSFRPGVQLVLNEFGIPQPAATGVARIPPHHLDVVFMPLVGFDPRGWRLGSGAGFYDRYFHQLRRRTHWKRPKLVGIAYECQRVAALTPDAWDVPMDAVITEAGLHRFEPRYTEHPQ